MSTDIFGVRVLAVEGAKVSLRVFQVYYDDRDWGPPSDDKSFVLQLISPELGGMEVWRSALDDRMCEDDGDVTDEDWVTAHAADYVASVRRAAVANYPLDPARERADFYYYSRDLGGWQDEDELVSAVLEIELTHPSLAAHLEVGMTYGTTAAPY